MVKVKVKEVFRLELMLSGGMPRPLWSAPEGMFLTVLLILYLESFSNIAGSGETPTLDTIDSYMRKLHGIILSNPQSSENLINTVRDLVSRLDRWADQADACIKKHFEVILAVFVDSVSCYLICFFS